MKPNVITRRANDAFAAVRTVGLTLPDVEAAIKYDGSPVLKLHGVFLAGLASHVSAEPATLVVRCGLEDRAWLLEEAPDIYYVTEYYRKYPVVLARLTRIHHDALRDLLIISWRLALDKTKKRRRRRDVLRNHSGKT